MILGVISRERVAITRMTKLNLVAASSSPVLYGYSTGIFIATPFDTMATFHKKYMGGLGL